MIQIEITAETPGMSSATADVDALAKTLSRAARAAKRTTTQVALLDGELDGVGDKAKTFGDGLGGLNKGLGGVGRGAGRARQEVEGLGRQFDGLNDSLNRTWGRAGDVISRIGDLEDMVRIFSGFVLLDAIQTAGAFVTEMYRMTDAGRKAQSMAEGLAEGLKKVTNGLDNVDIRKAVQLAAAMGKSKEQTNEYQRALDAAIDKQVELNAELEKKLKLEQQGDTDSYAYRNTLRNIEILTKAVESQISVAEVEKQKAQERAFAAGQVERALVGEAKAAKDLIPNILRNAEATAKATLETVKYRVALQQAGNSMNSTIDVFARLGAAGVATWQGISKAAESQKKDAAAAKRAAEDRLRIERDLQDRQTALIISEGARRLAQLDLRHQRELQAFKGTAEQRKQLVALQTEEMLALERELEQRSATERENARKREEAALREALERRLAAIQRGASEAAAASQLDLAKLGAGGGFDEIDARADIQVRAAKAAADAEIAIAQAKGESVKEIETNLQTQLLVIEQERLDASKALTEQYVTDVSNITQSVIGTASALADSIMAPQIQGLENRVNELRVKAEAAKGTAAETKATKDLLKAEREVAKARAKQAKLDAALGAAEAGAQAAGQFALAAANWANPIAAAAHIISGATHVVQAVAYGRMAALVGGSAPSPPSKGAGGGGGGGLGGPSRDPAANRRGSGSSGGVTVVLNGPILGNGGPQLDAAIKQGVSRAQGVMGGI